MAAVAVSVAGWSQGVRSAGMSIDRMRESTVSELSTSAPTTSATFATSATSVPSTDSAASSNSCKFGCALVSCSKALICAAGLSSAGSWSSDPMPKSSKNCLVVANKAGRPTVSRWPIVSTQPRSSSCLMMSELMVTPRMSSISPRVQGWR